MKKICVGLILILVFFLLGICQVNADSFNFSFEGSWAGENGSGSFVTEDISGVYGSYQIVSGSITYLGDTLNLIPANNTEHSEPSIQGGNIFWYTNNAYPLNDGYGVGFSFNNFYYNNEPYFDISGLLFGDDNTRLNLYFYNGSYAIDYFNDINNTHDFNQIGYTTRPINNLTIIPQGNTAPVPEPATMLLLGSGLFGLAGFRKKIFKK